MKVKVGFSILFLSAFVLGVYATEKNNLVAVSPASEMGIAKVGTVSPTFSWTAMDWAAAYRVEVFQAGERSGLIYDKVASSAQPMLVKEIQGAATSWTPTADEGLGNEVIYVWFVQALDEYGKGSWSQGRMFQIETGAGFAAIEETVNDTLEKHGVTADIIDDVLGKVKEITQQSGMLEESGTIPVRVQGTETGDNTLYGQDTGDSLINGHNNSFFGYRAGYKTHSGGSNTFIGSLAGYDNAGASYNTFVGIRAGTNNSTGNNNTYIGSDAGYTNQWASNNCMLGFRAGYTNTGHRSSYLGTDSGYNTNQGNDNVFIGYRTGYTNVDGDNNTYLGNQAGRDATGSYNVFVGYDAGYNELGDNKLYIDNSDTSDPLIWGDFSTDTLAFMGTVGVGTKAPGFPMEMKKTGANASIVVDRTDGATNYINATATFGNFGTVTNHPLRLVTNAIWRMRINSDNSLTMKSGASCTTGGVWTNASSRDLKDDIKDLNAEQAIEALNDLKPVTYKYKADKEDQHVGFIAEDVPDLVASKDRKGMSAMDVVAVLTKVLQEQQKINEDLRAEIAELRAIINQDK